jgi:hypothetical protein
MAKESVSLVPAERIIHSILLIRGQKVILDSELALLYGVTTARLNEQVKRNSERFPDDFMFQLVNEEYDNLKSQFATSSMGWGGRRKLPYVFTEHGAIMAAGVLNSNKAVEVSIFVVRAFVKLRQMLAPYKDIIKKVEQLETKLQTHDKHITAIIEAIKLLMPSPEPEPKPPVGYLSEKKNPKK